MSEASAVEIFTDGACSGNPGPGGWGAILRYKGHEKELSGAEAPTTNNRMEMMAAIAALEALKRPSDVRLYTDSQYLRDGITNISAAMEGARLEDRRQEAGEEHRSVAAARGGAEAAQGRLALGARPCRPPRERARRRIGARRHPGGATASALSSNSRPIEETSVASKPPYETKPGNGGETHQQIPAKGPHDGADHLTTNQGIRVSDNQNSLKSGARGPTLLEDFVLREKIFHFDHERIPERIVHARGSAAHGYFEAL